MGELIAAAAGGVAVARGRELTLFCVEGGAARVVHRVTSEVDVQRLHVAARGDAAIFGDRDRAWVWRAGGEARLLAARTGPREQFAVGFAGAEPLVLRGQSGALAATTVGGEPRFTAELRKPRSIYIERFVELPDGWLALHGVEFSDPFDTLIGVTLGALAEDAEVVQRALARGKPLVDRAPRLIVGPGPGASAVVYRDPETEEPRDPDDDPDELPDVWGFRGFYLRELGSGALLRRVAHDGPIEPDTELAATADRFVLRTATSIRILDRGGREAWRMSGRAIAYDAAAGKVAMLEDGDRVVLRGLPAD